MPIRGGGFANLPMRRSDYYKPPTPPILPTIKDAAGRIISSKRVYPYAPIKLQTAISMRRPAKYARAPKLVLCSPLCFVAATLG